MEKEIEFTDPPDSGWSDLGVARIRVSDVQAWSRGAGDVIHIWLRYREEPLCFTCNQIQIKAFELAVKNK